MLTYDSQAQERKRKRLTGNDMAFFFFKPQSPPPLSPSQTTLPTVEQAFKYMSLWVPFLFTPPQEPQYKNIVPFRPTVRQEKRRKII